MDEFESRIKELDRQQVQDYRMTARILSRGIGAVAVALMLLILVWPTILLTMVSVPLVLLGAYISAELDRFVRAIDLILAQTVDK